jgi:lysophospholipase L1-like esterase
MTQILLLGDSHIAYYYWKSRMPSYHIENMGVPDIVAADLFASLPQVKHQVQYADVIMIMIGTNDLLAGNYEFINTLKKIIVQLSRDYPTAEIIVSSLFPMEIPNLPDYTISNLNSHIEAFTVQTGCCFLDTHRRFSDSDQPIFLEDGIHITEEAYEIWARSLLEHIAFLIEND